jgi:hypothetical protein
MTAHDGTGRDLVQEETEQALVQQFLKGDPKAYDRLLGILEPMLTSYLRGQLRSRPEVSVDDVLQDVRIYLFQRLDRYNPEYPLGVFARGLAKNVVKRHLFKKSDLVMGPSDPDSESDVQACELSPQEMQKLPKTFRDVIGDGRFEDPDGPPPPSREFLELFEAFLRYGGYPHQQVSFGYSILIWGKRKHQVRVTDGAFGGLSASKVPVTGDPDRVVSEIGPEQLWDSSGGMLDELEADLRLDEGYLKRVREPLDHRLELIGKELFAKDRTSQRNFTKLSSTVTGQTLLQEYFGKDPRKSVADWTHGVKERVKKAVLDPASRKRIPLPGI